MIKSMIYRVFLTLILISARQGVGSDVHCLVELILVRSQILLYLVTLVYFIVDALSMRWVTELEVGNPAAGRAGMLMAIIST